MPSTVSPVYRVDMNIAGTTTTWALGVSRLGTDTILRDLSSAASGATFQSVAHPLAGTITRGKSDEMATNSAGKISLTLDNDDGRYSPENRSSSYYPNIVTGRQVRVFASVDSGTTWIALGYGYVDSWLPQDEGGVSAQMVVQATDWLGRANRATISGAYPAQREGDRVLDLFTAIGPDGLTLSTALGSDTVRAKTYTNANGLAALNEVATAFRANVFQARDGTLVYRDRYDRWRLPGLFAATCILDQPRPGAPATPLLVPYVEPLTYDLTNQGFYNEIRVTASATGESERVSSDATSQTNYGRVTLTQSSDLWQTGRAGPLADALLYAYKEPRPRVHSVRIELDAAPIAAWPAILGLELGNTVRVIKREPAHASIDRTMFIEGITHTLAANKGGHVVELQLTDTRQYGKPPWILGQSQIGVNTSLTW